MWQRTAQNRLTLRRHAEAFAQTWTLRLPNNDDDYDDVINDTLSSDLNYTRDTHVHTNTHPHARIYTMHVCNMRRHFF